ncbi:MAG: DUF58 domain-containing protein [Brevinematales bacterium]|nr:DUF58 domain-containing protein [Brevinematales bacterium]
MEKTKALPESIQKIISRVKHLEIRARKLIKDQLTSQYHSVFKGKGIEFSDVREYSYGDDVRDIDWNVTARMREPYIKQFVEERQLTVYFVVDISSSTFYGKKISKRQIMAEIAAFLGFIAYYNQDKVGLVLHTTEIELFLPAKHNYSQLLRIIRDIWYYSPRFRGTSLAHAFEQVASLVKKPSILFLLSDFLDGEYDRALSRLCDRHEVIPLVVHDESEQHAFSPLIVPWNRTFPPLASLEDIETLQKKTVLLGKTSTYEQYRRFYTSVFRRFGLDFVELASNTNYFQSVEKLLAQMTRARHHLQH